MNLMFFVRIWCFIASPVLHPNCNVCLVSVTYNYIVPHQRSGPVDDSLYFLLEDQPANPIQSKVTHYEHA